MSHFFTIITTTQNNAPSLMKLLSSLMSNVCKKNFSVLNVSFKWNLTVNIHREIKHKFQCEAGFKTQLRILHN